jgi:hypothetical protein
MSNYSKLIAATVMVGCHWLAELSDGTIQLDPETISKAVIELAGLWAVWRVPNVKKT